MISASCLLLFSLLLLFIQPINLNLWIVIGFLAFSLYFEWKQRRYVFVRFLLERYYGNKMDFETLKPIYVKEEESVIRVLEQFNEDRKHLIVIEKEGTWKLNNLMKTNCSMPIFLKKAFC